MIMLQGQYGSRNKKGHLFAVCYGFKCSPDGNFGFPKTNISAYEPVHGIRFFHIAFHLLSSQQLVRRVFKKKGCFQLLLQVSIRRKGKTFGRDSFRVKLYQVPGNVLNFFLGLLLYPVPGTGSQFVYPWSFAFLAFVPGNSVQPVNVHIQYIVVPVYDLNGFLYLPVQICSYKPTEYTYSVINMYDIISHLKPGKFVQCDLFAFLNRTFQVNPVDTLEKLVVRVITDFIAVVRKTFVQGYFFVFNKRLRATQAFKNIFQPSYLCFVLA